MAPLPVTLVTGTSTGIGDVLQAQGKDNLAAALDSYRASHGISDRLAKTDPNNARWQVDLSVSHERIGEVLRAQGNLAATLDAYKASLAIRERIAKTDPSNTSWQRYLALSYGRVAMILVRQEALSEALTAFVKGRDIIVKLQEKSPDNATLTKDFAQFESDIAKLKK